MSLTTQVRVSKFPFQSDTLKGAWIVAMSAMGQKQTWQCPITMSALPPKADMCSALGHVRFVPIADIAILFDHLVGAGEKRGRHG